MWNHLQRHLASHSPHFEPDLLALFAERQNAIVDDLLEQRLQIDVGRGKSEDEEEAKQRKLHMLRDQSSEIQRKLLEINENMEEMKGAQQGESRLKPFEIREEKLREYEEFLRRQKKEKEERQKAQEDLRRKEQELLAKK